MYPAVLSKYKLTLEFCDCCSFDFYIFFVLANCQDVERHFSREELRDLFTLNRDTISDTHDRLVIRCFFFHRSDARSYLLSVLIVSPNVHEYL